MFLISIYWLLYALIHHYGDAACPNSCSGHGYCEGGSVCSCFTGFTGGAADCSMRTCPTGKAWADKAYATDKAHQIVECSNAGLCNRKSGQCDCFDGYTGNACQRSSCPNDCSGRGNCLTINDISVFEGPPYDPTTTRKGNGRGAEYSNWDKNSITVCECDIGYFGADCSIAMCPKGDDPLTINQNYRQLSLTVYAGDGYFSGTLGIQFMGSTITLSLTSPSSTDCSYAFEHSLAFGYMDCSYDRISASQYQYSMTIYSWPVYPYQNNLHHHDGNPEITDFYCDTSNTNTGVYCVFDDVVNTNIREYEYCSLRGRCDFNTGLCACDSGFGGPACSNLTYTYISASNALPGLEVLVNEVDYIGTALQVVSKKSSASDYYLIEAISNQEQMFSVRGDGLVGIKKLLTITGGHTIAGGGLSVLNGGCTILNAPLYVYTSSSSYSEVASFQSKATSLNSSYAVLKISSSSTSSSSHYLISAKNQDSTRFSVRGDGSTFIHGGGAHITGGLTIHDVGVRVQYGGISINNGGLQVLNGGISVSSSGIRVTSGVTINSGGLRVVGGGMQVYAGGMSIYSGGLRITGGGLQLTSAGIAVTGGLTVNTRGISVTGGLTVSSFGAVITGDVSVSGSIYGSMLSVSSLYVGSGGMTVEGSLAASTPFVVVTSDRRLKTHIEPVHDAMMKISRLRGVYFNWMKDSDVFVSHGLSYDDDRHVGLIAQDVYDVIPEAVAEVGHHTRYDDHHDKHDDDHSRYLGIDYSAIVPVLINAMQEIDSRTRNISYMMNDDNKMKNSSDDDHDCDDRIQVLESKIISMEHDIQELKDIVHKLLHR